MPVPLYRTTQRHVNAPAVTSLPACRSQATNPHGQADEFAESAIPSFPAATSSSKTPLGPLSRQPDWLAAPAVETSGAYTLPTVQSNQSAGQPDVSAKVLAAPAKLPSLKGVPPAALPVPRRISGPATPAPGRIPSLFLRPAPQHPFIVLIVCELHVMSIRFKHSSIQSE